jgi:hypothetical protein
VDVATIATNIARTEIATGTNSPSLAIASCILSPPFDRVAHVIEQCRQHRAMRHSGRIYLTTSARMS